MTRRTLISLVALFMGYMPCATFAQETIEADASQHIRFEGIEVKGDIYEFADSLRRHGYKLEKRMGNQQFFLFKGLVAGRSCYFQVGYTKKSRTVWRIVAQVSHVEPVSYVDSVSVRYGEVFDSNERGYQWMQPGGSVMFMTPVHGDPTLIIIDANGYLVYRDEDILSQRQR